MTAPATFGRSPERRPMRERVGDWLTYLAVSIWPMTAIGIEVHLPVVIVVTTRPHRSACSRPA